MTNLTIVTKYLPATNTKGSRIKAKNKTTGDAFTICYPYNLSGVECHVKAVECLLNRKIAPDAFAIGELKNGYVFVANK